MESPCSALQWRLDGAGDLKEGFSGGGGGRHVILTLFGSLGEVSEDRN